MDALRKVYKSDLKNTIIDVISTEETKARGSRLDVLKYEIEIANHKLELMYTKPATTFNPVLNKHVTSNRVIISVFFQYSFQKQCNHAPYFRKFWWRIMPGYGKLV